MEDFAEHEVVDEVEDLEAVDFVLQRHLHVAPADRDRGVWRPELAVQLADLGEDAVRGQGGGGEAAGQHGEVG